MHSSLDEKMSNFHLMEIFGENCNGDHVAIEFKDQFVTYEQLENRINQVANLLSKKKIEVGDMVGLCLDKSIEVIIWMFGIMKVGAIYLPLSPTYPQKRVDEILSETSSKTVVTSSSYINLFSKFDGNIFCIDKGKNTLYSSEACGYKNTANLNGKTVTVCLFTSGSTGSPKGVLVSSTNLVHMAHYGFRKLELKKSDKYASYASLIFTVSLVDILTPLFNGITLVIIPEEIRKDPSRIMDYINNHKITCFHTTPVIFEMLPKKKFKHEITFLRVGGESPASSALEYWSSKVNRIVCSYGLTESTAGATMHFWMPGDENANIGKAWGTYKIHILDDHLKPITKANEIGELYIEGLGVAIGYLGSKKTEKNDIAVISGDGDKRVEKRFLRNPFYDPNSTHSSRTILRTGDFCRFNENMDVIFIGRMDHQKKIRGNRINVLEIERAIRLGFKEIVKEVIVGVKKNPIGIKTLVAYIILKKKEEEEEVEGELLKKEENKGMGLIIRDYLIKSIPDYMVPNNYIFVNSFPRTVSGKVDRLRIESDIPIFKFSEKDHTHPRNDVEKKLAEIWKYVLFQNDSNHNSESKEEDEKSEIDIGIYDDFFELGGNSLLLTLLRRKINDAFGTSLSGSVFLQTGRIDIATISMLISGTHEVPSDLKNIGVGLGSKHLVKLIQDFRKYESVVDWSVDPPIKYYCSHYKDLDDEIIQEMLDLYVNSFLGIGEKNFGNPIRRKVGVHKNPEAFKKDSVEYFSGFGECVIAMNLKTDEIVGHVHQLSMLGLKKMEKMKERPIISEMYYQAVCKVFNEENPLYRSMDDFDESKIWVHGVGVAGGNHPSISYILSIFGQVIGRKRGYTMTFTFPSNPVTQQNLESISAWRQHEALYFEDFVHNGGKPLAGMRQSILDRIKEMGLKVDEVAEETMMILYLRCLSRKLDKPIEEAYELI